MQEMLSIILRVSVLYIYLLALLRLSGKRSIGELSPLDFIVALVLGDMADDLIFASQPVAAGLVGAAVILFLHTLVGLIASRSSAFHRLVAGRPVLVVFSGKLAPEGMNLERTPASTVEMELRLRGEQDPGEVQEAYWEANGAMSMLQKPRFKDAQKEELPRLKELFK
jgi:uncharacterized membrane protein YcaP (DUF421 family)